MLKSHSNTEAPDDANVKPTQTILFFDHTAALSGGEISLLHLVRHLDRTRYVPVVVLGSDGPLRAELMASGIETHVLPLPGSVVHTRKDSLSRSSLLRLRDLQRTLRHCRRLASFIRRRRAGIVHTYSLKADIIGGLAGRLAGVPVVWHIHDRIEDDYLPPKVVRVFRWLCRIVPHHVIAVSAAVLKTLALPRPDFATVVHNGVVETRSETQSESQPNAATAAPRLGIIGRITPWKGQHIFIQAARQVRERFPDACFQIIGAALFDEKDYETEVRALATELKLDDCLEWTGFRRDVPALLGQLDVLVHASTTGEPFGQVVIEGMAAGKPVVATDGGGIPEIVRHGVTGLLVPMGDANALAEAIIQLLSDPEQARAMGQAGRQRVLDHFTIGHTAARVEAVYAKLSGKLKRSKKQSNPL